MKALKPFLMAIFGTFVEYYDYALYGFSAPILAAYFFPKDDPIVGLLQTYGIFIAGSCAKPLGSLLFGYLGDRFGRAFALKISIVGIAIPTLSIGLLPDFYTIGVFAPLGLLLCRIFQGIFVSGESDVARVFLYEMFPEKYRCLSNSAAYFICMFGISAASIMGPTVSNSVFHLGDVTIASWRVPFLFGGALGLILFILRRNIQESPLFKQSKLDQQQQLNQQPPEASSPFSSLLKQRRAILITLLMTGAAGGQYHFYFIFLNTYLAQILKQYDVEYALVINSRLLLLFTLLLPLAGFMADQLIHRFQWNLQHLLKKIALCLCFFALLNIIVMSLGKLSIEIMILTVITLAFAQANTFVLILNQFEITQRCKGVSLGHSLGSMLLSGTVPMISLSLWKITSWQVAPFFYFLGLCIISSLALALLNINPEKLRSKITRPIQKSIKPILKLEPSTILNSNDKGSLSYQNL